VSRTPEDETRPAPAVQRTGLVGPVLYLVGWAWPLALALSGVASDLVRIPEPIKWNLTIASLALPFLIARYGGRCRLGCASALLFYNALSVLVMWYWN
jgi:hypothetical protein